ncbi:hypothetical protein BU17DRAFT_64766 [Hysterangium stoloniferum]|nr:hypothetical protein BU17DRAFT_64766 [Hysterangium stoloniferum]
MSKLVNQHRDCTRRDVEYRTMIVYQYGGANHYCISLVVSGMRLVSKISRSSINHCSVYPLSSRGIGIASTTTIAKFDKVFECETGDEGEFDKMISFIFPAQAIMGHVTYMGLLGSLPLIGGIQVYFERSRECQKAASTGPMQLVLFHFGDVAHDEWKGLSDGRLLIIWPDVQSRLI